MITVGGHSFNVTVERDQDMGATWEEHDGHGKVSDWTTRDKAPGELVLCSDRSSHRFYDFAESVRIAKRDGWDTEPYGQGTAGQRAARAAMADYEHLRAWCNDEWYWVGVIVESVDHPDESESLWGIESSDDKYLDQVAQELAEQIAKRLDTETNERSHWEARDVQTKGARP